MIASASQSVLAPSLSTGTLPFGFMARNSGLRCSPLARSTRTKATGEPRCRATAQAFRGLSVSA
jgi:hypothetical protein